MKKITLLISLILLCITHLQAQHNLKGGINYIILHNTDVYTDTLIINHVVLKKTYSHIYEFKPEIFNIIFRKAEKKEQEDLVSITCFPDINTLKPIWGKINIDTISPKRMLTIDSLKRMLIEYNSLYTNDNSITIKSLIPDYLNPYANNHLFRLICFKNGHYYQCESMLEIKMMQVFFAQQTKIPYFEELDVNYGFHYYIDLDAPLFTYGDYNSMKLKYGNWQATLWRAKEGRDKIFHSFDELYDGIKYNHFWRFYSIYGIEDIKLNGFMYVQNIGIVGGSYDDYMWELEKEKMKSPKNISKCEFDFNTYKLENGYREHLVLKEIIYTVDKVNGLSPKEYLKKHRK